jgi:hypothetical protein
VKGTTTNRLDKVDEIHHMDPIKEKVLATASKLDQLLKRVQIMESFRGFIFALLYQGFGMYINLYFPFLFVSCILPLLLPFQLR